MTSILTLPIASLETAVVAALMGSNTSAGNAQSVMRALIDAEIDGHTGHGLSRVPSYAAQARAGKIDGSARPVLVEMRPAVVMIDAAHGFAYPAFDLAIADLPARAERQGMASAGIFRSHHGGALGLQVERLADRGLVALMVANTPRAMSPFGGGKAVFGTNPLAFACPRSGGAPPIVIDMALSEVARGKIVAAAGKGQAIPLGWALDRNGRPTTDAGAALEGTLLPAGGAKGAALALMVEVLAAALTGSSLSVEASSFLDAKGAPPATGQTLIAIDPAAFSGQERFARRIADLAAVIEDQDGARLPGTRRLALRETARHNGLVVDPKLYDTIRALAV